MGKMDDARRHAKKIEYYYHHAGERGYGQAIYHWDRLSELALPTIQSKNDKGDLGMIRELRKSCKLMMDEMKSREDAQK